MQLSETLVGQQGACPSCGQTITVQPSPTSPPVGPPPAGVPPFGPPVGSSPPEGFSNTVGTTAKKLFGQVTDSLKPMDSDSQGNIRYPNLSKYLALSETLIKIGFIVGLVLLLLGVVAGILAGVRTLLRDPVEGILIVVGSILGGALYLLFLWLWRLVALAMTELLRVFMDIEINTRRG